MSNEAIITKDPDLFDTYEEPEKEPHAGIYTSFYRAIHILREEGRLREKYRKRGQTILELNAKLAERRDLVKSLTDQIGELTNMIEEMTEIIETLQTEKAEMKRKIKVGDTFGRFIVTETKNLAEQPK